MDFDWDAANIEHIRRHDVEPFEVVEAFKNSPIPLGKQEVSGEVRYLIAGQTDAGRVLRVVWTPRGMKIRPVTAHESRKLRALFGR
jgi:uncharacterized protein